MTIVKVFEYITFKSAQKVMLKLKMNSKPFKPITLAMIATTVSLGFAPLALAVDDDVLSSDNSTDTLEQNRTKTKEELDALKGQASEITNTLRRLEANIQTLKKDQKELQEKLDVAEARQNALDERIISGESKLAELEGNEVEIKTSLRERNAVLAEVLAALQRLGSNPPPALLVSPEDALSSVRSAILLGAVVPEIRSETEKLISDLQDLANIRKEITSERTQLAEDLDQSFNDEKELTALLKEKAALNVASIQQLEKERKRATDLQSKSKELETVIASLSGEITLIKEAAEIARLEEIARQKKAAEQLERARQLAEANRAPDQELLSPAYSFAGLQNTLKLPVAGSLAANFGEENEAGQALSGILVSTENKTLVLAPVDGWILYSGPFRTYGNIIILNAGDNYHMVFAGMDQLKVSQGQFVVSGEPLASMGQNSLANNNVFTLASDKPTLYIELRKDQRPIDSAPWWANITSGRASNDT